MERGKVFGSTYSAIELSGVFRLARADFIGLIAG
jgi:hypothetical protein